jgi:hypothetical protein
MKMKIIPKKKHKPRMLQILPIRKLYHEWRGKPSPIGNVGRPPTSGWAILISNNGGGNGL